MRQLEQAQIQSAMEMDEDPCNAWKSCDVPLFSSGRSMERYQYECGGGREEIDVDEMTYEEMLELGEHW